jgi:hypothetical protein
VDRYYDPIAMLGRKLFGKKPRKAAASGEGGE